MAAERPVTRFAGGPLLAGLLFLVMAVVAVMVWVPLASCPVCEGAGRRTRVPSATQCLNCDHGRVSVLKKWQQRP
jgi:hypothetical protein